MKKMNKKQIVLVGASGTGKHEILRALETEGFWTVATYTTRKPQAGEINGKDHVFVSVKEFTDMANAGELACIAMHAGAYYGVPVRDMGRGNTAIALTAGGARAIRHYAGRRVLVIGLTADRPTRVKNMILSGRFTSAQAQIRAASEQGTDLSTADCIVSTGEWTPAQIAGSMAEYIRGYSLMSTAADVKTRLLTG